MLTVEDARRFALSLPEATEQPHFEMSSFRVRGKIFATVPVDEAHQVFELLTESWRRKAPRPLVREFDRGAGE
ncbi:MAG: hypothetical protein ACRDQ5_07385 [Sciscionella sp.]